MWDFDCLHFAQYILINAHIIDCKQSGCKKIYRMEELVDWNPCVCQYCLSTLELDTENRMYLRVNQK